MSTAPNPTDCRPCESRPIHYKVDFENDRVGCSGISYGPAKNQCAFASRWHGIFLNDQTPSFTLPTAKPKRTALTGRRCGWLAEATFPNLTDEP